MMLQFHKSIPVQIRINKGFSDRRVKVHLWEAEASVCCESVWIVHKSSVLEDETIAEPGCSAAHRTEPHP